MLNMPLMQQVMHGAKHPCGAQPLESKRLVVGVGMTTTGRFAGVHCLQLQPTVRNWQSISARYNVSEDASTTSVVWILLHCVAVINNMTRLNTGGRWYLLEAWLLDKILAELWTVLCAKMLGYRGYFCDVRFVCLTLLRLCCTQQGKQTHLVILNYHLLII